MQWTARGFASYGTTTEHPCKNTVDLATALINKGLADQSKDNMSAIVVALPNAPEFSSVSATSPVSNNSGAASAGGGAAVAPAGAPPTASEAAAANALGGAFEPTATSASNGGGAPPS